MTKALLFCALPFATAANATTYCRVGGHGCHSDLQLFGWSALSAVPSQTMSQPFFIPFYSEGKVYHLLRDDTIAELFQFLAS